MSLPHTRRTTSLTGSSRLSLSVGNRSAPLVSGGAAGKHLLRQEWSISYVHRPPGTKVDYEKEIHKVATFGSAMPLVCMLTRQIESFLHLYAHLTPPDELEPVTDILFFASRIQRPGIWEEMVNGGKFTIRLLHTVTPVLYEALLFALIGDQFDEPDNVVGCVLSVRQTEDILSVWVEEEGDGVRSGALREKILHLLGLPATTMCEYRSNKALLDAATAVKDKQMTDAGPMHGDGGMQHLSHSHHHSQSQGFHPSRHHERGGHFRDPRGPREDSERRNGWANGFRREQ